jgi:hypothetical protein
MMRRICFFADDVHTNKPAAADKQKSITADDYSCVTTYSVAEYLFCGCSVDMFQYGVSMCRHDLF